MSNPPPYAAVSDWSGSRIHPRTPSPDRRTNRGGPPPYEALSHRPEDNPSGTVLPPPSYEQVMTGHFRQIQPQETSESVQNGCGTSDRIT